ncbi:hypothetical protein HPB48_011124 [Haemaphysalis longicornis]|uniref:Monocarboxylate transporter n=1 Tax=Haemaphysalis longicornis TaxID=44386 RepID=A0A9J6GQL7_HAELO|nr:hypothetical protein HPB48_011124 [Haemaphysalis longicornis]
MDYFDQYRGTVSGLKYLGWSASGLVFPVILSALVDIYGLQGTLFLSGGLVLNIVPIVFLLRKPTHTMTSRCCGFRRDFRRNITSKTRLLHEDSSLSQGYTIDTGTLAEPKCQGIAIDTLRMYASNWRTEDTLLQSAFHGGESVPGSKWSRRTPF